MPVRQIAREYRESLALRSNCGKTSQAPVNPFRQHLFSPKLRVKVLPKVPLARFLGYDSSCRLSPLAPKRKSQAPPAPASILDILGRPAVPLLPGVPLLQKLPERVNHDQTRRGLSYLCASHRFVCGPLPN